MAHAPSHFLGFLNKLRWVQRWSLKRNVIPENVMEHSFEASVIAHFLKLIHVHIFNGTIDLEGLVEAALYHDATEALTGDLPSPVKYADPNITQAYHAVEKLASEELLGTLPEAIRAPMLKLMHEEHQSADIKRFIKAADMLSAYLKCQAEIQAGNQEHRAAAEGIEKRLKQLNMQEVNYFLDVFAPSYTLSSEELQPAQLYREQEMKRG